MLDLINGLLKLAAPACQAGSRATAVPGSTRSLSKAVRPTGTRK